MAATETRRVRASWPIAYERRTRRSPGSGTGVAWALFLGAGVPFLLMTVLTVLARAGIYVDLLRPLWQPWPPDLLKPFLGVAVFAATLAFLAYRIGRRRGFRAGSGAGLIAGRSEAVARFVPSAAAPLPPPPPPDDVLDGPL